MVNLTIGKHPNEIQTKEKEYHKIRKIFKNMFENILQGVVTSIIGVLFLIGAIFYFVFSVVKQYEIDTVVLVTIVTIGTGLLFSPDNIIDKIRRK